MTETPSILVPILCGVVVANLRIIVVRVWIHFGDYRAWRRNFPGRRWES